jgi:hypothetical protein
VNEVKLFVDNSHVGGVAAPVSIVVDGTTYLNLASTTPSAPEVIDITGLHLTGDSVTVTEQSGLLGIHEPGAVHNRRPRSLDLGDDGACLRWFGLRGLARTAKDRPFDRIGPHPKKGGPKGRPLRLFQSPLRRLHASEAHFG